MVLLVSYECGVNGIPLMIVGEKDGKTGFKVLNAYSGEEATKIYNKLLDTEHDGVDYGRYL